jgi:CheY-like chemotaxis protein
MGTVTMSTARRDLASTVMIVEDDRDVRLSLAEILAEEGYRVSVAEHGVDALRQLRTGWRPGVIVLDLMMPVMDGWEFLAEQRSNPALSSIPVIILTAAAHTKGPSSSPVVSRLRKPVDVTSLLEAVAGACARYRLS